MSSRCPSPRISPRYLVTGGVWGLNGVEVAGQCKIIARVWATAVMADGIGMGEEQGLVARGASALVTGISSMRS